MKPLVRKDAVDIIDGLDECRLSLDEATDTPESISEVLSSPVLQHPAIVQIRKQLGLDLISTDPKDETDFKLCQITDKFSAQHPSVYEHPFREPDLALTIHLSFDPVNGEWEAKIPGRIQDIGQNDKYTPFGPNKRRKDLIQKAREELLRRFRTNGHVPRP